MHAAPDRHLDLGCGPVPRNPYGRSALCGVDIQPLTLPGIDYRVANVVVDPIPFPDGHFGSVSAFDVLEHVPRVFPTADGRSTRFPFIELMDEIWRVLAPGGRLYAVTPAFPDPSAFVDPTHVNILTDQSHHYFCGDAPLARMYGFKGRFRCIRSTWVYGDQAHQADIDAQAADDRMAPVEREYAGFKKWSRGLRAWSRRMRGKPEDTLMQPRSHLLWEFEALK